MADVLEVTSENITREHVLKRIDDWVGRLNDLYGQIEQWLPNGWHVSRERTVFMDEEMMRRFKVEPRQLPVLDFSSSDGRNASLQPRGLWIVGANGRVDLYSDSRHFVIVDNSERFLPPDWHIADFNMRRNLQKLNKGAFLSALAA